MENDNKAQKLMERAEKADQDFNFLLAYRLFIQASQKFDYIQDINQANICLMRAATCLEKFQGWRGHSALSEYFGNRLGNLANPDYKFKNPNDLGQSGMFHIMSWQGWKSPENGYYRDDRKAEQLHQQAWAYMWGAEEAEAGNRYSTAGKLFRKAAISWELSKWGERAPEQADNIWTKEQLEKKCGNKWKNAAKFYFKAAYNYIQDKGRNPKEAHLFVPYEPSQVGWKSEKSITTEAVYKKEDDVDRMVRCWRKYGEIKNDLVNALEECDRQVSILLNQIHREGKRQDSKILYQKKKKLELDIYKLQGKRKYYLHKLYYHLTGSGSSVSRTILFVFAPLYILIFPLIYLKGLFGYADDMSLPVNFGDAVLFSLANVITITVNNYAASGFAGNVTQIVNSLSAFFVIGYVLWIMTRSFED